MQKLTGLFIGLTTVDIQYIVKKFPETNIKIKSNAPEIFVGGPATNAAVAFSKLEGESYLISSVGKNPFSTFISNDLKNTKIQHIDLSENKEINPVLATVVTSSENGHRNIFTHHPETVISNLNAVNIFEAIKPQIVLLDGFNPEFGLKCAQLASQKGIPVVMDCGSWKPQYDESINFTDIVIASADFFPPECKNENDVLLWLQTKNITKIAISKGEDNLVYVENGEAGEISIEKTKVVDTLGAGDFLHGAFCAFFSLTADFKYSLQKAAQVATFSCKFYGTREWLNFTI